MKKYVGGVGEISTCEIVGSFELAVGNRAFRTLASPILLHFQIFKLTHLQINPSLNHPHINNPHILPLSPKIYQNPAHPNNKVTWVAGW